MLTFVIIIKPTVNQHLYCCVYKISSKQTVKLQNRHFSMFYRIGIFSMLFLDKTANTNSIIEIFVRCSNQNYTLLSFFL